MLCVMRVHVSVQLHRPERGIWCLPLWPLPPSYCFETIGLSPSLKLMDLARPAGQRTLGIFLFLLPSLPIKAVVTVIYHTQISTWLYGFKFTSSCFSGRHLTKRADYPSPSFVLTINISLNELMDASSVNGSTLNTASHTFYSSHLYVPLTTVHFETYAYIYFDFLPPPHSSLYQSYSIPWSNRL